MAESHREHPEDQKAGCVVMSPGHPPASQGRARRTGQTVPVSDVTRCRLRTKAQAWS